MRHETTAKFCLLLLAAVCASSCKAQAGGYWQDPNGGYHAAGQSGGAPGALAKMQQVQQAGQMGFAEWQDPAEAAFSAQLPQGWQISGGTQRTTRIEPHYVIRAQSPSGGVQLFMDNPRIAIRQVPNMMTMRMGMREGQAIPSAWGGKLLLERYQPAPQAAEQYVRQAWCPSASDFQGGIVTGQTQDLNQQFGAIARAEGKQIHVDVGELHYRCGDRIGYVYAITLQVWQPGGPVSMWLIYRIAGYLATPAEAPLAASAIHQLLGTFQMNPQWLQSFARECSDTAGNVIRESNAVTQSTIQRIQQEDQQSAQQMADWQKNANAQFKNFQQNERARMASPGGDANGHDYNAQLNQKTVCNSVGDCAPVDANVTNWWFDCSGTAHPGSETGDPPPSSESACWNKGN